MRDAFYTPVALAAEMIEVARARAADPPVTIADFAAGSGELLREARRAWRNARIVAADIDKAAVEELRRRNPDWTVGRCDFTDQRSRGAFLKRSGLTSNVDLVLLNPPFSCRGGSTLAADVRGHEVRSSLALSFLIEAIPCLSDSGQIVAILPAGSLTSEKDAEAWSLLREVGQVETIRFNHQRTFPGTTLRTAVVRFSSKVLPGNRDRRRRLSIVAASAPRAELVRGTVQMHTVARRKSGFPLVHTTELRNHEVILSGRMVSAGRTVEPPCVLVPRVGQPSIQKIVLYDDGDQVALSDCVIALRCGRPSDARSVHSAILRDWDSFRACYVGSCAPYLTVRRLAEFLSARGISVEVRSSNRMRQEVSIAI